MRNDDAGDSIDVSVLVPAKDEAENLPLFMEQAAAAFAGVAAHATRSSSSTTAASIDTWAVLAGARRAVPVPATARGIASRRGIADALRTGYLAARGDVLVFYPADLQFKPEDIPRLVAPILAGESDMVTGFKEGKYEKAFVSGIYNRLSRTLFDVPVKDLNSVKAYRREIMDALPMRPDWHRYMIVIAAAQGFTVSEIPVPLYPRHAGKSKFATWHRIPVGVLDMLVGVVRAALRPEAAAAVRHARRGAVRAEHASPASSRSSSSARSPIRPLWTVIQTCLILGSIFFATGLIGEQIAGQRAQLREIRRQLDEHGRRSYRTSADR